MSQVIVTLSLLPSLAAAVTETELRSGSDGLCLQPGPLRWGSCDSALPWTLHKHAALHHAAISRQFTLGRSNAAGVRRVCADRWCLRCISRGNSNRARLGLCILDGFEAVVPVVAAASQAREAGRWALRALALGLLAAAAIVANRSRAPSASARGGPAERRNDEDMRRMRLSMRSTRDQARPSRLVGMLHRGGLFTELVHTGGGPPLSRPVLLRVDSRMPATTDVYDASNPAALAAGTVNGEPPASLRLHRITPSQLLRLRFAQPASREERQADGGHPASDAQLCVDFPWRCSARLTTRTRLFPGRLPHARACNPLGSCPSNSVRAKPPKPSHARRPSAVEIETTGARHLFVAETDDQALHWFEGLQVVLQSIGEMPAPASTSRLLWTRARLRLAKRARVYGGKWNALVQAVREAPAA